MAPGIHPRKRPGCCSVWLLSSSVTFELQLPFLLKTSSPLQSYKTPPLIQSGVLAIIALLFSEAICILKENA